MHSTNALRSKHVFPFLSLPRELRDQIYDFVFDVPIRSNEQGIERRQLRYFKPSPAAILLLLHHEYFLLNRQVAHEALEACFKNHTVFFSCGPYVLKQLLAKIEETGGPGKQWLRRIKSVELEWTTFPNLRIYPPERGASQDESPWDDYNDGHEIDVDYVRGAQYNSHFDEHDYEGGFYDDNFYDPEDTALYPQWPRRLAAPTAANDPFGFTGLYPFVDPHTQPPDDAASPTDINTKLALLVSLEVTPLFEYLSSPLFALTSLTLPLYFISKSSLQNRSATRPGYALPTKLRYWVHVCAHALVALQASPSLQSVRVKYMPWDIWASMEPADDLQRVLREGIWFRARDAADGVRDGEGEAFRAVWAALAERGVLEGDERMGLRADVRFVKWEGVLDSWRVGDELEVVFEKGGGEEEGMDSVGGG